MTSSCIYNGSVIHKRFKPKEHFFKYKVFSLFIDLSELNELNDRLKFFSLNRFNLISFYEKDHGDRDGTSLLNWVKLNLSNNNINTENSEYMCLRDILISLNDIISPFYLLYYLNLFFRQLSTADIFL